MPSQQWAQKKNAKTTQLWHFETFFAGTRGRKSYNHFNFDGLRNVYTLALYLFSMSKRLIATFVPLPKYLSVRLFAGFCFLFAFFLSELNLHLGDFVKLWGQFSAKVTPSPKLGLHSLMSLKCDGYVKILTEFIVGVSINSSSSSGAITMPTKCCKKRQAHQGTRTITFAHREKGGFD